MRFIIFATFILLFSELLAVGTALNKTGTNIPLTTDSSDSLTVTTQSSALEATDESKEGPTVPANSADNHPDVQPSKGTKEAGAANGTAINETPKGNSSNNTPKDGKGENGTSPVDTDSIAEGANSTVVPTAVPTAVPARDMTSVTDATDKSAITSSNTDRQGDDSTAPDVLDITTAVPTSISNETDESSTDSMADSTTNITLINGTSAKEAVTEMSNVEPEVTTANGTAEMPVTKSNTTVVVMLTTESPKNTAAVTAESSDEEGTTKEPNNNTKDEKTSGPEIQTTAESEAPSEVIPTEKPKSHPTLPSEATTDTSSNSVHVTDDKDHHGKGRRLALGILIPCLVVLIIFGAIFAYRKSRGSDTSTVSAWLKKKGRGYITLDDLGNFQGMNNPNYDPEL